MRHRKRGRRFNRVSPHRDALFRNMATALFREEKIRTTLPKAKELRRYAEKLITKARRGGLHNRRQVLREIHDAEVVAKLFDQIGARYADRPGGYTRITRAGFRPGDGAAMAFLELVEAELPEKKLTRTTKEEVREVEDVEGYAPSQETTVSAEKKDEVGQTTVKSAVASRDQEASPVGELDLPPRLTKILEESGVETIRDIVTMSEDELLALSGLGEKSVELIRDVLETRGLWEKK